MTTEIHFIQSRQNSTRGHEVALVKDQCRLDVRKYSFSQRTERNRLLADCVGANSVNLPKTKLTNTSEGRDTPR